MAILAICLVSFLIGLFTAYNQYYFRGLSGAETHQFISSTLKNTIIESSYKQQQPPLDYYFSSFANELLGMKKSAVRLHSIIFYLILSLILPLMLWILCSSLWAALLGSLLFAINNAISFHSADGRPLSLTLLTGSLFLFFYICCCKNSWSKKSNLFFSVLSSQYLFIVSIGLQPVIFVSSLFISSFYLLFKGKKLIFKKLFLSHVLTAFLALPIYIKMFSFGQDAHKFKNFSLEKIGFYIRDYNFWDLFKRYFYPFYEQLFLSFLLLILGLTAVVFIRKKISCLTVQTGCVLIIFPLLFDFLFEAIINWDIVHWYFIVYSLFLIFFCVLAFNEILQYLKENLKNQNKKSWRNYFLFIPISLLFLLNCYFHILTAKQKNYRWRQIFFSDYNVEKVYDHLKEKGTSSDLAVEISLTPVPFYRLTSIRVLKPFLYDPNHHPMIAGYSLQTTDTPPFFYEKLRDEIPYIQWKDVKRKPQKIFFITVNDRDENDKTHFVLSKFMMETQIGKFSVFEWTLKTKNHEEEYKNLFIHLITKTPLKYQTVLYETLLYYACKNKNKVRFVQLLKKYKKTGIFSG